MQIVKKFNRLVYFLYYLKNLNAAKFKHYLNFSSKKTSKSVFFIVIDIINSILKYNISILDYFYFRFYEKISEERYSWAGTGYMYEFQLAMNPKNKRDVIENKIKFLNNYKIFIKRSFADIKTLNHDMDILTKLLGNSSKKVVIKLSTGQVGAEVKILECGRLEPSSLLKVMSGYGYDLIEEFVVQHPDLMALSPTGLNTIRIFTQIEQSGGVKILGCRLRVSVNSTVDNMAAGNIAAPINEKTGIVCGPGVYSDITKQDVSIHPVTLQPIEGFQVPFWQETLKMAKEAALFNTANKSIGWDIAITSNGPELIEGNHNWCKLLWQLPVKKGLKPMIDQYLIEYKNY